MVLSKLKATIKNRLRTFFTSEASVHPLPIFIWGPPGVGKSSIVKEVVKELTDELGEHLELHDVRVNTLESVDFRGIPYKVEDNGEIVVKWSRPYFIPSKGKGVLFFDELNTGLPDTINACLQLFMDRRVGEHKLGDGWYILGAGNRVEDGAHVYTFSSAITSRMVHLTITPQDVVSPEYVTEWVNWALENGVDEPVVQYIQLHPKSLFRIEDMESSDNKNFPNPRCWAELGFTRMYEVAEGFVGDKEGVAFKAFLKNYEEYTKVDVTDVLEGKNPRLNTDNTNVIMTIVIALCYRTNEQNIENILRWLETNKDKIHAELIMVYLKGVWKKYGHLVKESDYGKKLIEHVGHELH